MSSRPEPSDVKPKSTLPLHPHSAYPGRDLRVRSRMRLAPAARITFKSRAAVVPLPL